MNRARKKKEEMNGNSLAVLSSGVLAGAERCERGEPQRRAAAAKAGDNSGPAKHTPC